MKSTWEVVVRRRNGRLVKSYVRNSRYAAKQLRRHLEERYDEGYYVEIGGRKRE